MVTGFISFVSKVLSLSWLTGPIFGKELRVSSRRRRNYVLRFGYLALLTVFLILLWINVVDYYGSALNRTAQMAEAGKMIITFIVWFQFCATQLVAIIMLSTSISDEIYNRTLGLLMTTPINSFQIVAGKLFSKLLQLILLLAISLPLLAVVRVFGGVPWAYLISSLCVTLTAVIFVGSVSLFFSIFSRRAYVVIILTKLTLGTLFALLPLLVAMWMELYHPFSEKEFLWVFYHANPYLNLAIDTEMMMSPRRGGWMPTFYWPLHCGIMLAGSVFIFLLSVVRVRKVALRQATGRLETFKRRRNRVKNLSENAVSEESAGRIRSVNGSPTVWKELRAPLLRGHKIAAFIVISLCLLVLFATYAFFAHEHALDEEELHMLYVTIFMGLGMLFTIVLPATCITSEKESRSWPLLLATTLSDEQILFGKFIGVLRRCLPVWLFLFGHVILFVIVGYIHPIAIFQLAAVVTWVIVFLSCTGLYFSSRFRRSTTAVIMNFAFAAAVWALIPLLLVLMFEAMGGSDDLIESYMDTNPFVHAIVVMDGTVRRGDLHDYNWVGFHSLNVFESTCWMFFCMLSYVCIGFLFAWRAKCRIRRNVF